MDGEKTFDVSKAVMTGTVKAHETVVVKYVEKNGQMLASSVSVAGFKTSMNDRGPKYSYGQDRGRAYTVLGLYDPYTHGYATINYGYGASD